MKILFCLLMKHMKAKKEQKEKEEREKLEGTAEAQPDSAIENEEQTFSRIDRSLKREKTVKNFWSSKPGKMLLAVPKHLIKFGLLIFFLSFCFMIHIIRNPEENIGTDINI